MDHMSPLNWLDDRSTLSEDKWMSGQQSVDCCTMGLYILLLVSLLKENSLPKIFLKHFSDQRGNLFYTWVSSKRPLGRRFSNKIIN